MSEHMRKGHRPERPLIGITTGKVLNAHRPNDPWVYAQTHYYVEAIIRAGGAPVLLPFMEDPDSPGALEAFDAIYERMHGIVLAGGNDVSPKLYNEELRSTTEEVSRPRDATELHLAKRAKNDEKPLLAICRGMQLWNVAQGGSLYLHLPDDVGARIDHVNSPDDREYRHDITIEQSSRLGKILQANRAPGPINVNSFHHQAVREIGQGLTVVARAEDQVIEAIETTDATWFALGIQWHPELMSPESTQLFEAFINACAGHR
jgi:putative glutamine amidotransferase